MNYIEYDESLHGKLTYPEGFIIKDNSELDGSGYEEFKLYLYLICVTKDFENKQTD